MLIIDSPLTMPTFPGGSLLNLMTVSENNFETRCQQPCFPTFWEPAVVMSIIPRGGDACVLGWRWWKEPSCCEPQACKPKHALPVHLSYAARLIAMPVGWWEGAASNNNLIVWWCMPTLPNTTPQHLY